MNYIKFSQPLLILLILILVIIYIYRQFCYTKSGAKLLDYKDKLIITSLSIVFAGLSFSYFAVNYNFPSYSFNTEKQQLTLNFAQPQNITSLYYYYGMGDGNLKAEYLQNKQTVSILFDNTLAIYKWKSINLKLEAPIKQLIIAIDKPDIELKQLALFDQNQHLVTNFSVVSSSDQKLDPKLIVTSPPKFYQNTLLSSMYFDEIYYARTAYEYLHGLTPYVWVHPPLGMLIIAVGILLFGMTPFGWRFMPNLFGIALITIIYIFAKRLFKNRQLAIIASLLLIFEFMHFAISRQASIDSIEVLFILAEYYFLYSYYEVSLIAGCPKRRYCALFYCGIFFGLGVAVKWEAVFSVFAIIPCLIYIELWLKRPTIIQLCKLIALYAVFLILIPLAFYSLSYIPYFYQSDSGNLLGFILNLQKGMLDYHTGYTQHVTHPYASDWWEWPLMIRPLSVYFYQDPTDLLASSIVLMGNPLIWWYGLVVFIASFVVFVWCVFKKIAQSSLFKKELNNRMNLKAEMLPNQIVAQRFWQVNGFLFLSITSLYAPWIFIGRLSFIYYFYEVVPFFILLITSSFQYVFWQKYRYLIYIYLLAVMGLFILFYPALAGIPLLRSYIVNHLLWFKGWNF